MFNELRPISEYVRLQPNLVDLTCVHEDLISLFRRTVCETHAICPAEGYYHYDRCFIYDGCFVMDEEFSWLPDSVADYSVAREIIPVIKSAIDGSHFTQMRFSRPKVVIGKGGFENHGHVIVDILPKLVNLRKIGLHSCILVLPLAMKRYSEVLQLLLSFIGLDSAIEFHAPATLKEARDVFVLSAVSRHNDRKSPTFLEFADIVRHLYRVTTSPKIRIYVPRAAGERRSITNGPAVEQVFTEHGFRTVHPAELSFGQQVELFACGSVVAGPLGAGLANIGWGSEKTSVLMIDPGIGDYFYWDLSCMLRQSFNWLFAGPLQGFSDALSDQGYEVDLNRLRSTLSHCIL